MNKNAKILCLALAIVLVLSIALVACDQAPTTYTLTLTQNGQTQTVSVKAGESYTLPTPQDRDGYVFVGWYDNDTLLDYTITPTRDMNIVGKWDRYDQLAEELKVSLKTYLESDAFKKSILTSKTTQSRVPLLYLRYVKGDFYDNEVVMQFKTYLNMIGGVCKDGRIGDSLFPASDAGKTGWYGVLDFLYSWSLIYNQYQQWCNETGNVDTSYNVYFDTIKAYLTNVDSYVSNSNVNYTFKGAEIMQSNLYNKGYNALNSLASSTAANRLTYDDYVELLGLVAQATGNVDGHDAFLAAYKAIDFETIDAADDKRQQLTTLKNKLIPLWKACMPVTQVGFGYGSYNVCLLTAYNLGFDLEQTVPGSRAYMLSYYEKDEDGNFKKNGGTPNWVGFSGRPLSAAALRDTKEYDVKFEKTMQGYFPYTDGWGQPLDEMINMDRLCNWYNHDLGTSANVAPQYGLLYGFMNGIDMEHYVKEVYHSQVCKGEECKYHIEEQDGQVYNIVTLWRDSLKKDENGKYVISTTTDMAVAIAYIAQIEGIEAPAPVGAYSKDFAVINL